METAAEARTLAEMSNYYCHPGKAGGSLAYARDGRDNEILIPFDVAHDNEMMSPAVTE
jgi:hypothetical protein